METIERIINLLNEKNISQREFAIAINIPEQKITDWKGGRTKTYFKYMTVIAEYLNVSVDYLLGKTDQKEMPTMQSHDEQEESFLSMFDSLSPEAQKIVLAQMEFLAAQEKANASKK